MSHWCGSQRRSWNATLAMLVMLVFTASDVLQPKWHIFFAHRQSIAEVLANSAAAARVISDDTVTDAVKTDWKDPNLQISRPAIGLPTISISYYYDHNYRYKQTKYATSIYFVYLLITQRFSFQQILWHSLFIPSNKCWPNRPIRKQIRDHRSKSHLSFVSIVLRVTRWPAKNTHTPTGVAQFQVHLRTLQDLFLQVLNLHDAAGWYFCSWEIWRKQEKTWYLYHFCIFNLEINTSSVWSNVYLLGGGRWHVHVMVRHKATRRMQPSHLFQPREPAPFVPRPSACSEDQTWERPTDIYWHDTNNRQSWVVWKRCSSRSCMCSNPKWNSY